MINIIKRIYVQIVKAILEALIIAEVKWRGTRMKPNRWHSWIASLKGRYKIPDYALDRYLIAICFSPGTKLAYLEIPKVASTSIKKMLIDESMHRRNIVNNQATHAHGYFQYQGHLSPYPLDLYTLAYNFDGWKEVLKFGEGQLRFTRSQKGHGRWYLSDKEIDKVISDYFVFTFVRNPFARIVSCFQNKYIYKGKIYNIDSQEKVFFWVRRVKSFDDFVYKISKLADCYLESHTIPQFLYFNKLNSNGIYVDWVGHFESMEKDFQTIQKCFNLPPLGHENVSRRDKKNYRQYYTPKTAKLIYERYKEDFVRFGYEEEYPRLLKYLDEKAAG